MTTEEKAKAYDESIGRAKEMIKAMTNIGGVAKVDDIQYLFPELKESEEIELSDFESELFSAFSDGWQQYLHGEEVDMAQWAKEHSFQLLQAAKQELKPAERSEEDELMRKRCIADLGYLTEYEPQYKERCDAQIAWLEKQKEQKPAEWSAEDERMLRLIRNAFKNGAMSTIGQDQWLKSLPKRFNLQPQAKQEQKPEAKLTGWVARDRNEGIWVYNTYPEKDSERHIWKGSSYMPLDQESFPDLKWKDEPMEVEITIKKKIANENLGQ